MAKIPEGIYLSQEKSGFLILGQNGQKDTLLSLNYRNS